MAETLFSRIGDFLHRRRPWYKLPRLLAMPRLVEIRNDLRKYNLHDTEEPPLEKVEIPKDLDPKLRLERTIEGTHNDLQYPKMGCAGARFGRNCPLELTHPDTANLMNPSPREVSQALMTRHEFQPAGILNLMAASWIQFMVHDWFVHETDPNDRVEVPLEASDDWPAKPMTIAHTRPAPAPPGSKRPPAYRNLNSHWWDGSQIYGCDAATIARLRTFKDGKLKVQDDGRLLLDSDTGIDLTGFSDNWWIGLSMLHALFALEHNSICDRLKSENPTWSDDELYGKARLINAALMAKIHTVEWTPAILPHPVVKTAMNTNWNGLAGEDIQDVFEFLNDSEILGGIIGSKTDHHAAPYSLTEEFVAVYRMHPLMPDEFVFRSIETGEELGRFALPDVSGRNSRPVLEQFSMADLFYSFGVSHPGAIRLHNYPRHLQNLVRDDGTRLDLATIDIFRDRERGVPRYNQFRKMLRLDPIQSFDELTDNAEWREEIKRVYNGDIEKVDLMVGLYAEPLPQGFGFSETAFRIFVLMASRRLKSDRFFTNDYTPEVYTQTGIDWVKENGMASVLKRHFPAVAPALEGIENPFAPWKAATGRVVPAAAGN